MAAGNFTLLNLGKLKIVDGTIVLGTNTFKAALTTAAWTNTAAFPPATAFVGTSGAARYADLATAGTSSTNVEVANGNGYTTGGVALTGISLTQTTGTVTFTSAAVSWSSATFDAKYIVVYSNTATNKDILGYMDLNVASTTAVVSPSNGTLTVTWNASGMFTIT
jgi:hypothetical protein